MNPESRGKYRQLLYIGDALKVLLTMYRTAEVSLLHN